MVKVPGDGVTLAEWDGTELGSAGFCIMGCQLSNIVLRMLESFSYLAIPSKSNCPKGLSDISTCETVLKALYLHCSMALVETSGHFCTQS